MQLGCSLPVGDIGTGAAVLRDYTQAAESWTPAKSEATPCFSGRQVEELSLTLPPGREHHQAIGSLIPPDSSFGALKI